METRAAGEGSEGTVPGHPSLLVGAQHVEQHKPGVGCRRSKQAARTYSTIKRRVRWPWPWPWLGGGQREWAVRVGSVQPGSHSGVWEGVGDRGAVVAR